MTQLKLLLSGARIGNVGGFGSARILRNVVLPSDNGPL